jgi:hypothetical protein
MILKQIKNRKITSLLLVIFSIIMVTLIILFILFVNENQRPTTVTYFNETFSNQDGNQWKLLDAALEKDLQSSNQYIALKREEYVSPHLTTKLDYKDTPQGSFVLKFSTKVNQFMDHAIVLATIKFSPGDFAIVLNRDGKLGIARNMFGDAIYSKRTFSTFKQNEWQDVTVFFDIENEEIVLYLNNKILLQQPLIEQTYPIHELWLGSVWIGGKEKYGAAIDVKYDSIEIANEGLVPQVSYPEFIRLTFSQLSN